MENKKRSYHFNIIEAKDGKMCEVMNFNFGGHHDLAAMAANAKSSGVFDKEKHADEFVVAMRLLHHVIKKNADKPLFADFAPHFKAFKEKVRDQLGCCECRDNDCCDEKKECTEKSGCHCNE